ncbi:MAG TPA: isopentenyl transferase family protein, partial [Ginsengibacter sp.]|nr:isopentenyl transferase family protein [Ginsengibacter sp.]
MNRKTCIIISGPTAVGKTDFAIELAQKHKTQIISADSRQCYKELNIGVDKPSSGQLKNIQHYFISSHSIHEDVNVKLFEQYALLAVKKIFETNDVVIVVGGTGLYIKAFCEGIDDIPTVNEKIRNDISDAYKKNGIEWLQKEIQ